MIWHSHFLNPRCYLEDCLRIGRMDLWATGFPWAVVDPCINSANFTYFTSADAQAQWQSQTGMPWLCELSPSYKRAECSRCKKDNRCAWTTLDGSSIQNTTPTVFFNADVGIASNNFSKTCVRGHCTNRITHDSLRIRRFKKDVATLLMDDTPMKGTLLHVDGKPQPCTIHKGQLGVPANDPTTFPDRLIKQAIRSDVLDVYETGGNAMQQLRALFSIAMADGTLIEKTNILKHTRPPRGARIATRKMVSNPRTRDIKA